MSLVIVILKEEKPLVEQPASSSGYPGRVRIALALILSAVLLSQLAAIVSLAQRLPLARATEGMTQYEKRFAEARKVLPRSGLIGYLSDPAEAENVPAILYQRRYVAAGYNLAPLIIAKSTEPQLILGNFFSNGGMERAMAGRKLVVLQDFHNGVFILRKETP